jgi:phospholipase/carboxylesterase
MTLRVIEIESAPNPTASIIVLHGLGADGNDFVPVARELNLGAVGPVRFIFPHAPQIPVTINGGHVMNAWYDILELAIDRREDEAGLRKSQQAVDALIDHEKSRGIPASRIVLAGFSQGCAMTLLTGIRHRERLAGLAALSGYMPLLTKLEAERHAGNHDVPIFMAHGRQDPVVNIARGIAARDALVKLGYDVEWHDYPMPHSVSAQEIADLNKWLLKVLTPR